MVAKSFCFPPTSEHPLAWSGIAMRSVIPPEGAFVMKTPPANYAIHETGHVVVCQVLGIRMIRATANPSEPFIEFGDQQRNDFASWLYMWVAGLVAEHLYGTEMGRLPLITASSISKDTEGFQHP
jgi:hypothetical protein